MLCNGVCVCGFDNLVGDGVVLKEVEEGNRCELYAIKDAARFCKVFGSRMVKGDEGRGGECCAGTSRPDGRGFQASLLAN